MSHAITGTFDNVDAAARAREELRGAGVQDSAITTVPELTPSPRVGDKSDSHTNGLLASLKQMFSSEQADGDRQFSFYAKGIRQGSVLITIDAEESQSTRIVEILHAAGATYVDDNAPTSKGNYDSRSS